MPQGASAVNRFDRFLKERKDSELRNLQKLKENLDEGDSGGTVDVKVWCTYFGHSFATDVRLAISVGEFSKMLLTYILQTLKELEEENEHLRRKVQMLEDTTVSVSIILRKNALKIKGEVAILFTKRYLLVPSLYTTGRVISNLNLKSLF